jgi:hypothetical protein
MTAARGFLPFPAGSRRRRRTWWGTEWIRAMEDAAVDTKLTRRGRRTAAEGRIGPITISSGQVSAAFDAAHRLVVAIEPLSERAWTHLIDEATVQSGHLAALLDGQLPHALADLLPTVGDLETRCGCEDWGSPCHHAAALCYQTAWLLDGDPALLFLLRGRSTQELIDAVAERHTPVTLAAAAFARPVPPLPDPPPPPDEFRPLTFGSAPSVGAERRPIPLGIDAETRPFALEPAAGLDAEPRSFPLSRAANADGGTRPSPLDCAAGVDGELRSFPLDRAAAVDGELRPPVDGAVGFVSEPRPHTADHSPGSAGGLRPLNPVPAPGFDADLLTTAQAIAADRARHLLGPP